MVQERMIKEMKFMTAANHYTPAESEKKRRSREQAADEKILRKDDGGIEGEQGGSSRVGSILHDAYRIVCHRSAGRRNGSAGSLCSCSDRKYIH